ncbi:hypothetical protein [Streptomyces sp. NPDC051000]|uniref:hypothetical protein n=1 Tax=Streptomyces sp. NPDC051000 TaxID=3155520 RepID=UPI0033C3847F
MDVSTVVRSRDRFAREGTAGLKDRTERPAPLGPAAGLRAAGEAAGRGGGHQHAAAPHDGWSQRLIADHLADTGISTSQVGRILAEPQLKPHRSEAG